MMKKRWVNSLQVVAMLLCGVANAQVGIGTVTPDSSAILELQTDHQGFLLPRLTTSQRDLMFQPATGLMIYNLTINNIQVNTGTPALPIWFVIQDNEEVTVLSVTATGDINTSSTSNESIPGMTLSPGAGNYLVLFNGQYGLTASEPVSTEQGVIDLQAAYNQLMAIPATNTTHSAIFGNGEILTAGVYELAAAASLAGTLTIDGGGDTTAVFIIRVGGALTTGAMTTVILTNGARASHIFWVAEGATALAANTIMKGTIIAHTGAVSAAAGINLEGRLFTLVGAIAFGPGTAAIPSGISYIDLGVLSTFVMFASAGAIANTGPSNITGDVGTNAGAIAGFEDLNGNVYGPGAAPNPVNNSLVSFSIYQHGMLISSSTRTSDINTSVIALQSMATVAEGEAINVWWRVDTGEVMLGNRILTLVKAGEN